MIIGIDISKQTFDTAWHEEEQTHYQQFDYTDEGMAALFAQTPKESHYVMEATGTYHPRLALKLYQAGRRVSVINPLVIKRYGQMRLTRAKSDKADAKLIYQYSREYNLSLWAPTESEILELQQAHSWLDDLIWERTQLSNRQEAHAHQATPSSFVARQMQAQQDHLDKQIQDWEGHLEAVVKKPFPKLYARLQTIPSIGPKAAIELIIITNGFRRFEDVKALCAYVGVSPTTFRSGTSVQGKGGISKAGARSHATIVIPLQLDRQALQAELSAAL